MLGKLTSLLSWVRRTATPASTLPTVNEISIVDFGIVDVCSVARVTLRQFEVGHAIESLCVGCF